MLLRHSPSNWVLIRISGNKKKKKEKEKRQRRRMKMKDRELTAKLPQVAIFSPPTTSPVRHPLHHPHARISQSVIHPVSVWIKQSWLRQLLNHQVISIVNPSSRERKIVSRSRKRVLFPRNHPSKSPNRGDPQEAAAAKPVLRQNHPARISTGPLPVTRREGG